MNKSFSKAFLNKTILEKGRYWDVHLHSNQQNLGRCFIRLKRAARSPFELTPSELKELYETTGRLVRAISTKFRPDLFNYAIFGNRVQDLHLHVIPRYKAPRAVAGEKFVDAAWGRNYANAPRKEVASETFEKLKKLLKKNLQNVTP